MTASLPLRRARTRGLPALLLAASAVIAAPEGVRQTPPQPSSPEHHDSARPRLLARLGTLDGHRVGTLRELAALESSRGNPVEAGRWWRAAAFLDPTSPSLAAELEARSLPPPDPPSGLLLQLGSPDPEVRRALSLVWMGQAAHAARLLRSRHDPLGLALRASSLGELGRFRHAEKLLAAVSRLRPEAGVVPFLLSSFAHWQGDAVEEGRLLAEAARLRPDDPDVRGALAARAASAGRNDEVRAFLDWEEGREGAGDPYRRVTRAALHTALGDVDSARAELDLLARLHPPGPQPLVVEAGLALREGDAGRGVRALRELVERAPGNVLLIPAANLLASVGRVDLAARAISRLEPALRDDPRVRRVQQLLAEGRDQARREGESGVFRYQVSEDAPERVLVDALAVLGRARAAVDARVGRPGPTPVPLVLLHTPGKAPWGYYDAVTRRVVFRGDFRLSRLGAPQRRVLDHVARHEYAHLAFDHLLRGPGEALVPYPRWLMEGVADQLAGGTAYLADFGYDPRRLVGEPLDLDSLARILAVPIMGMGSIPQTEQARAYRQAHDMVGALARRMGEEPWPALAGFIRGMGPGGDLERSLQDRFGLGFRELAAEAAGASR